MVNSIAGLIKPLRSCLKGSIYKCFKLNHDQNHQKNIRDKPEINSFVEQSHTEQLSKCTGIIYVNL